MCEAQSDPDSVKETVVHQYHHIRMVGKVKLVYICLYIVCQLLIL